MLFLLNFVTCLIGIATGVATCVNWDALVMPVQILGVASGTTGLIGTLAALWDWVEHNF